MTESKQEYIMFTLQPLFQFIKDRYVVAENPIYELPVQQFYENYVSYCDGHHILPLSKVAVTRTLSKELDITSTRPYVDGKRIRFYSILRKDLYKKYLTKNWIHETNEIDIEGIKIPKKPASDPKALNQFLAQFQPPSGKQEVKAESSKTKILETEKKDLIEKKDLTEKKETPEASPAKKAPPPVPPKPDQLKVKVVPVKDDREDQKDEDVQEGYGEYLERIEEIDPKPKEGTQAYWDWFKRHKWDRKLWVKKSQDIAFNDLYNTGKKL
jgi:hypothetical protein